MITNLNVLNRLPNKAVNSSRLQRKDKVSFSGLRINIPHLKTANNNEADLVKIVDYIMQLMNIHLPGSIIGEYADINFMSEIAATLYDKNVVYKFDQALIKAINAETDNPNTYVAIFDSQKDLDYFAKTGQIPKSQWPSVESNNTNKQLH